MLYNIYEYMAEGIIVATAGAALVRSIKSPGKPARRRWIPVVALVSGPVISFGWLVVDAYYINPAHYNHPDDFAATAIPVVIIGLVAGVFGAAAFWIAER